MPVFIEPTLKLAIDPYTRPAVIVVTIDIPVRVATLAGGKLSGDIRPMGFGSIFRKLSGSKTVEQTTSVEYEGYTITPAPREEGGKFYTAGIISKTLAGGEEKRQEFVRSDTHASFDAACDHALQKARQIIDERGDGLFELTRG